MANIKSINGNPIVVGTSGIENGAVTTVKIADNAVIGDKINDLAVRTEKLANNAVTTEKIAPYTITYADISVTGTDRIHQDNINDNAVNTRVIADGAVTGNKLATDVKNEINSVGDDASGITHRESTSLNAYRWTNGGVQTNSSTAGFGQILVQDQRICLETKVYADSDIQVYCDDGWAIGLVAYSSTEDSSCKYGQSGYTYNETLWKRILVVPKGDYFRIVLQKMPTSTSDVLDPSTDYKHVHFVRKVAGTSDDIAKDILWRLGEMVSGVPNWARVTHLISRDILTAEKPLKIAFDDSIVRPYVYYYDENDVAYSIPSIRATSIPKGARYRLDLNVRDGSSQGHYGMVEAISIVEMEDNFIWYGTSATNAVGYSASRIIMCMTERHDYPVAVSLSDYTKYKVGAYLRASGGVPSAFDYEPLYRHEVMIPAGQWHNVYLGKVDDSSFTLAEIEEATSLLKVKPIYGYDTVIDGLRNEVAQLKVRISDLEGNAIPNYYESDTYSLDSKIADILSANQKSVESVVQFAFVTDFHANVLNQQFKTRVLLNKIFNETNCRIFVNGGDTANGKLWSGSEVSSIDFAKVMEQYANWLIPDKCALSFTIAGNHDGGVDYNPFVTARIDEHTLSEITPMGRTAGNVVVDPNSECSCYVDDEYHKIRWIAANYGNVSNVGKWSTESSGVTGESNADCLSFVGCALGTMPKGWTAVIFNHILINYWTNGQTKGAAPLESLCDMYNQKGSGTLEGRLFDFSNAVGEVACIIGGHLHIDYDYETAGGIPCIITTTDNCAYQYRLVDGEDRITRDATLRPAGTPYEQAIDVFTIDTENKTISTVRIGFGTDRSWTY